MLILYGINVCYYFYILWSHFSKVILITEGLIIATLKWSQQLEKWSWPQKKWLQPVESATTKVILATVEVIRETLKVI